MHPLKKIKNEKIFLILGNQLFNPDFFLSTKMTTCFIWLRILPLCSYEKHHKHKIIFLSSMRSFRDELRSKGFQVLYKKIDEDDFKDDYTNKLKKRNGT